MVRKVSWAPLAISSYIACLEHLESEWTDKEVKKFMLLVQSKINALSLHPQTGKRSAKRVDLRQLVINKRVVLIYRYRPLKHELELIHFFNTYQDPGKMLKDRN